MLFFFSFFEAVKIRNVFILKDYVMRWYEILVFWFECQIFILTANQFDDDVDNMRWNLPFYFDF